jgi:hypothetical protein
VKKLVLTMALFLGLSIEAQSANVCTNDNLMGEWTGKYIVASPLFVGACTVVFDNNLIPSGKCDNLTDGESVDIFDGIATISKRCNVKASMTFNNSSKMSTIVKMTADKQHMSGTLVSSLNGKITKGKITLQKTGGLSCQVVHD